MIILDEIFIFYSFVTPPSPHSLPFCFNPPHSLLHSIRFLYTIVSNWRCRVGLLSVLDVPLTSLVISSYPVSLFLFDVFSCLSALIVWFCVVKRGFDLFYLCVVQQFLSSRVVVTPCRLGPVVIVSWLVIFCGTVPMSCHVVFVVSVSVPRRCPVVSLQFLSFDNGFDVFRSNKIFWNVQDLIACRSCVFWTMNMTNIDGKHSKTPYSHVKHKNTRKQVQKWSKIHFFLRSTKYWKYLHSEVGWRVHAKTRLEF